MEFKMKLHQNPIIFEEKIRRTAQFKGLSEGYVEKDYWVSFVLKTIFASEIGSQTIFKGGTALQKCFDAIERFSEDIDVVVLRNEGETDNQLTTKIKNIGRAAETILPEMEVESITHKRGKIRKTAHPYERLFQPESGQVRDYIVLEATWLGHFEPYTTAPVQSFIAEMMQASNQTAIIEQYDLQPFEVQVLTKERTFCEKIMSLVRFSFTERPIEDLNKKVRHTYDLHKLLEDKAMQEFFDSNEFDKMLLRVANEDVKSFKNNNAWLANHPTKAILFADVEKTWSQMRRTYNSSFGSLVFGELPKDKMILGTLKKIAQRLSSVEWNVEI
jgi:predicted nucleotidyltransferase component of viral defense system